MNSTNRWRRPDFRKPTGRPGLGALRSVGVAFAAVAALAACDQAPTADAMPEWKPADHHSLDENNRGAGGGTSGQQAPPAAKGAGGAAGAGPGGAGAQAAQIAQLVQLTWQQQCISCHGPDGQGATQMGSMLHARNLADPEWQAKTSDADMAAGIRNGKNKMPKFDLPDPVLAGLVARIRQLKGG